MTSLARYLHTVRFLRPVQIYGRLWHRLYRPPPDLRPAPPVRQASSRWSGPALREPSIVGPNRFRLLAEEREIVCAADWQGVHPAALWLYNLHYFDDLNAPDAQVRREWQHAALTCWLRDNPPARGVGWDPYPTSLRIVNWLRWILRGNEPLPGMVESLAIQTRHLRRRMEHHLLGNHLFANAKTLVFAGSFFSGPEADAWRAEGSRILRRELDEQVLGDGGHFERSPMYHALALEDVLDLLELARVFPGTSTDDGPLKIAAARMLHWLHVMTHPDGGFALFNDATLGVSASPAALAGYASKLGIDDDELAGPVVDLADTGYTRVATGDAVLFTDTGPLGPDYLPGHGHADTLSFELSIHGRRVIVDSGVSEYGTSIERVRQRGTSAHNTVMVDRQDSSEVWSGFRVARRARVLLRRVETSPISVRAEHDGYRRLDPPVTHARTWSIDDGSITIEDEITGHGRHRIDSALHLAPGITPVRRDGGWSLGSQIEIETDPQLQWEVRPATYHPAMGLVLRSSKLEGHVDSQALPLRLRTRITWKS